MTAYDVVEIPPESLNKHEVSHKTGRVLLDRFLFTRIGYPADYGFCENTVSRDHQEPAE